MLGVLIWLLPRAAMQSARSWSVNMKSMFGLFASISVNRKFQESDESLVGVRGGEGKDLKGELPRIRTEVCGIFCPFTFSGS